MNKPTDFERSRHRLLESEEHRSDAAGFAGITVVLAQYDEEVIRRVTDPVTGLARTSAFMPNIKELCDACDAEDKFLKAEAVIRAQGWEWFEKADGTGAWMQVEL